MDLSDIEGKGLFTKSICRRKDKVKTDLSLSYTQSLYTTLQKENNEIDTIEALPCIIKPQ
jgi:hypothetical protein